MVTMEQVKQLELRISKAIEYVNKITEENTLLKGKLDSYQNRIDELEILIQRFKEEQGRIEEGIVSALDRLNRFEDAVEKTLPTEKTAPLPEKPIASERPANLVKIPPEEKAVPVADAVEDDEILDIDAELEEAEITDSKSSELDIF